MLDLATLNKAILEKLDSSLVLSYDEYRGKNAISRDIDLICRVKDHKKIQIQITEILKNDFRLQKVIKNYYSTQLFYQNEQHYSLQIDLMDGLYLKHWQIKSAEDFFSMNDGTTDRVLEKISKYVMSRLFQIKRFLSPPGKTIVFLGCDGSGKTTTITKMLNELRKRNQKVIYKYLFPGLFPRYRDNGKGTTNTNPHGRNIFKFHTALVHEVIWCVEYLLGSLKDRYLIYQGYTIVYDRYFYDFEIDPARYRLKVALVMPFLGLFLRNHKLVILRGDPSEIYERKKETSIASIQKSQNIMMKVIDKSMREKIVIDTTKTSIDDSCAELIEFVSK